MANRLLKLYWILILCTAVVEILLNYYNPFLFSEIKRHSKQTITVTKGDTANSITHQLFHKGIISSKSWLLLYIKYNNYEDKLKVGKYRIAKSYTPAEVINQIVQGKVIHQKLTIIEGWKFSDLKREMLSKKDIKIKIINSKKTEIAKQLNLSVEFLDGAFLPETYFYLPGSTDLEILKKAKKTLDDFYKTLNTKKTSKHLKNKRLVLSMASLIEKESQIAGERAIISGVYYNRLEKNMLLQADPTVIYALGDKYDGNIRWKDLKFKNLYNTYTTKGLPPFPIAFSSRKSIEAALNPKEHDYLYFVAMGHGNRHLFSKTYQEHKKAVKKYLIKK